MIRFTLIFFFMIILFLTGVIVGFDQAGTGMNKLSGNEMENYDALVVKNKDEPYEVEVMGQSLDKKSIEEKKESYQEIQGGSLTGKIASAIEGGVKWFYNLLVAGAYQISDLIYRL
ncbi:DUF3679 domain-containing protein [Virgibacillus sp. MSP4-1]|uniref:DUF3679 domain-containing protein n=1 Tax=Virgibacillus sp. MSP4-1 TaxID=2700081 RepID=UPI0003A03442|nr:DUF3679 domain-containing protein [Virgibacillus sp. MSP4-1]QHS22819.1 DUF3679 domain-containing protein [Virgibacillus sp. MSP4-1]